ncbi:hypothetical protein ACG33_11380 [Steroidobacter denitrificans]|uniref:Pyridoxamine 5'-phosphate oxidase N-terminal domain-containing protein n=1 Tax=Steroidobacter denitrificans TaxID=465721 RepID=A0A127FD99_STEDE|nr:pyridoxamine 5'-phosphate oxidase family protein [Steroidobacter denitrificans]AMN47690.1 hypothetical protein ACG33_11380 [Steroidobacter denitrificans]
MDERKRVLDYLQTHRVMVVATAGEEGVAAAAVFYVNHGLNFYFVSAPHTRHCRNMLADPRVAITIHEDYIDWSSIKGVQMNAIGRELAGSESEAAQHLYVAKFPEVFTSSAASSEIGPSLLKARWYELAVNKLRFIDNARSFGYREEWSRAQLTATRVS